jgi:hypothetical protein
MYDFLCELYYAAREFIETYIIEDFEEPGQVRKVKSFVI